MTYGWPKTSRDTSLTKSPLIRIVPRVPAQICRQLLINAVTGEVGTGSNMSGKATYQESRIIPRNGCECYSSLRSIFREFKLLGSSSIAFVYASIARSFFPAFEYASPKLS